MSPFIGRRNAQNSPVGGSDCALTHEFIHFLVSSCNNELLWRICIWLRGRTYRGTFNLHCFRRVPDGENVITKWEAVRRPLEALAKSKQVLPFIGAAISYFQPTNLPKGVGLLRSALQGMFPSRRLFCSAEYEWKEYEKEDEKAISKHSPEVILQGLAEGLLDRSKLAAIYNAMTEIPPNPFHHLFAEALLTEKVPAIFTTNQDRCIEDAAAGRLPVIFDKQDFTLGLRRGLFQFHGAIGGASPLESARRRQSLTFTLNAMGPHLTAEHCVFAEAISRYTLLFLGYSGCDPDIWYSLSEILQTASNARVYWCFRGTPSRHLLRLEDRYPESIVIFQGNVIDVLKYLAGVWGIADPGCIMEPTDEMQEERRGAIREWATDFSDDERDLAYGWLLVSVGQHKLAAMALEDLLTRSGANQPIHMLAALFAGYARRELSDHFAARKHLRVALEESDHLNERCRYAQAAHKLGESLSAFESVRFWYGWPNIPRIHAGARWLLTAIKVYQEVPAEKLAAEQLGRAGLGTARMNLGQLYRRTAAYTPYMRSRLAKKAMNVIYDSLKILQEKEKDLRSLPMAIAAAVADDPTIGLPDKIVKIDSAIEYATEWNQDEIQIGSAYFIKGHLLAKKEPQTSEACYLRVSFRLHGCRHES